jgi:hypothetical protein
VAGRPQPRRTRHDQPAEALYGDIGLSSGWQGDNSGRTAPGPDNDWVIVPIAKNADGSPVSGLVIGRIVNASGPNSQQMIVNANPVPLQAGDARHHEGDADDAHRRDDDGRSSASRRWRRATGRGRSAAPTTRFPARRTRRRSASRAASTRSCSYQVVFTSNDDYVLGIGFAAFSDVASFFKYAPKDDEGTPNPVAGQVQWVGQPRQLAVGQHAAAS